MVDFGWGAIANPSWKVYVVVNSSESVCLLIHQHHGYNLEEATRTQNTGKSIIR